MWSDTVAQVAAVIALTASAVTGVTVIIGKLGVGRDWLLGRIKSWLDHTVGEVVEMRLTGRNGGESLMDSIDRIELDLRGLHSSQADVVDRVERLSSDLAVVRRVADERGDLAVTRTEALERHIEMLLDAVLHATPGPTPLYEPVDVTRRPHPEE